MPHTFTREVPPVTAAWHQNKAHFIQVSNFPIAAVQLTLGICSFSKLPTLVLVTRQEFQLLTPTMVLSKTQTQCCNDQKLPHLYYFHLWSFSSHQFRQFVTLSHTLLCRINKPLLSALCLILTSPAKASSTLVFQSTVVLWVISQQSRKMYLPHISGIASSQHFKTRKGFFW